MAFKQAFNDLLPTIKGDPVADCWHARLNHADESIHGGSRKELLIVLMAAATAGFVVQFPALFGFDKEFFYTRNIGFIRSEEHTSELQSRENLVCRLLLE